jgi:hypothetical protein
VSRALRSWSDAVVWFVACEEAADVADVAELAELDAEDVAED